MPSTPRALVLVSLALLGVGCKKGPDLVGKWTGSQESGHLDFEFKPDETFVVATKAGPYAITTKGTYRLSGDTLTLTTLDIDAPGAPYNALAQAKASPSFKAPRKLKVKFPSDDDLTLSEENAGPNAPPLALKRVRE